MLDYNPTLRDAARDLRKHQTEAETVLWSRLRRKQLLLLNSMANQPP